MKKIPKQEYTTEFKEQAVRQVKTGELLHETRAEMAAMGFEYIEVLYNRKRQHSTLGYKSPMRFLNDWLITQQKEKLIA